MDLWDGANMANEEAVSPETSRSFWQRLFSRADLAAAFSIVSALAFVGSIWLNSQAFKTWGLDFLQIATPADVLMSGLQAAGIFWLDLALFLLIIYMARVSMSPDPVADASTEDDDDGDGLSGNIDRLWAAVKDGKYGQAAGWLFGMAIYGVIGLFFLIVFYGMLVIRISHPGTPVDEDGDVLFPQIEHFSIVFMTIAVCAGFTLLCVSTAKVMWSWVGRVHNKIVVTLLGLVCVVPSLFLFFVAAVSVWSAFDFVPRYESATLTNTLINNGYFGEGFAVSADKTGLCQAARIIWVGERAVVFKCPDGRVAALLHPEDVSVLSQGAPHPRKMDYLPSAAGMGASPLFTLGRVLGLHDVPPYPRSGTPAPRR